MILSDHVKFEEPRVFAGLDIETTGSEIDSHITIQIGIALPGRAVYVRDVGPEPGWAERVVPEPEALEVNGFTLERIADAPRATEVDIVLADRLKNDHGLQPKQLIAIGWNVAGFDLPFVRRDLPRTARFFHYRTVDLNSIVFMLVGGGPAYDHMKAALKAEAVSRMGRPEHWHDAGFDAEAALTVFQILRERYGLPGAKAA